MEAAIRTAVHGADAQLPVEKCARSISCAASA
jgi:hypothetical protein